MRAVDRMKGKSPSNRKKRVKQTKSDDKEVNTEQKPEDVETDKMLIALTQFVEEGWSCQVDLLKEFYNGENTNAPNPKVKGVI